MTIETLIVVGEDFLFSPYGKYAIFLMNTKGIFVGTKDRFISLKI